MASGSRPRAASDRSRRPGLADRPPARRARRRGGVAAGGRRAGRVAATDVADAAQVDAAVTALTDALGPVDIAICSAGQARPGYFQELDPELFRQMMDVNYFGTVNVVRAVVPSMIERRRGSIVGVSSAAGLVGVFGYSAYAPTKFAVRGFLEIAARRARAVRHPRGLLVPARYRHAAARRREAVQAARRRRRSRARSSRCRRSGSPQNIIEGIEKERFAIIPDVPTRGLAKIAGSRPDSSRA